MATGGGHIYASLINLATFNFGNFQFWQLSVLTIFNFGYFQATFLSLEQQEQHIDCMDLAIKKCQCLLLASQSPE